MPQMQAIKVAQNKTVSFSNGSGWQCINCNTLSVRKTSRFMLSFSKMATNFHLGKKQLTLWSRLTTGINHVPRTSPTSSTVSSTRYISEWMKAQISYSATSSKVRPLPVTNRQHWSVSDETYGLQPVSDQVTGPKVGYRCPLTAFNPETKTRLGIFHS